MKELTKRVIIGLCSIILIIVMLIYIDLSKILFNLSKISFFGLFIFSLIYSIVFLVRSFRLKFVFKALNFQTNFYSLFGSYGIGWAINELTPGKIGDLARIELINEKNNIGISKSFCGIAIERFIDLFILFLISIIALIFVYLANLQSALILNLQVYILIGTLLILGGVLFLVILFLKPNWIITPIGKISSKLKNLIEKFLERFLEGIKDFKSNYKKASIVFLLSFPIWILETITLLVIFNLTNYSLNPFIIILAQIIIFFSKTFPITPGGWVISENLGALFIYLFFPSIPYDEFLALFILDHMLRILYIFIFGIISSISFNFKIGNLKNMDK